MSKTPEETPEETEPVFTDEDFRHMYKKMNAEERKRCDEILGMVDDQSDVLTGHCE